MKQDVRELLIKILLKKAKGYLIYRSAKKGPLCEADEKAGEEACICG